jgi:3-hydroxyisobutyrate dehydrogenase-like beta-hydroxyacid dehydrogenase
VTPQPLTMGDGQRGGYVIAVLGLGEAGGHFAKDLVQSGAIVRGYDPHVKATNGVIDNPDAASACHGADLVLSVNSAADAIDALAQGLPGCVPGTIWADLNTAAPAVKQAVHKAAGPNLRVVDVAIMAPVPAKGLGTPMTVSGPAADDYAAAMRRHGAAIDVIDGPVGAAATRKLLRSVFYKGLAAAVVEALTAAEVAGLREWLSCNISAELVGFNASTLDRLVAGSRVHAERRVHEMEAASQLLEALGVPARVSRASRDWLRELADTPPPSARRG